MKLKALNLDNSSYHPCKANFLEFKCKKINVFNSINIKHSIKTNFHYKRNKYNNHTNKQNIQAAQKDSNEDMQLNEYLLSRVIEAEEKSERLKKEIELLKVKHLLIYPLIN